MVCRCTGTMGRFINLRNRHRLWICDLCKGVRVFSPAVIPTPGLVDPNFTFFVQRHRARVAELVDARDLKSCG